MKGYVEKNLRENETVQAKCHVTWTAFVPIIVRSLLMGGIGFLIIYLTSNASIFLHPYPNLFQILT